MDVADKEGEKRENVGFYDEELKKCLEERKGEDSAMVTCRSIVEAFKKNSSSSSPPSSPPPPPSSSTVKKKPSAPFRLRNGCFTDV